MSIIEITDKVNELASSWEQFKSINDRRLAELERKGSADPLTLNQLEKLNNVIDTYQDKINQLEAALYRQATEVKLEHNSANEREYKKAFCDYLRKGKEGSLPELEKKTLSVGQDRDGGTVER